MNTTGWFMMFSLSVLAFVWAKRRQLHDRQREVAWKQKYGQIITAVRRTDRLSSTLVTLSPVVAIGSLIGAMTSLMSTS